MKKFLAPIGTIFKAQRDPYRVGFDWVYMGFRATTVGSELHYFSKFIYRAHLFDVWTYQASNLETLQAKFEVPKEFIVEEEVKTQ